jgi:CubicO group peptidase (beta-lactamase class C family)
MKHPILRGGFWILLFPFFSETLAQKADALVQDLDTYIQKGVSDWQVPGLSVAIVKNGQVLLAKGYGLKELGKPDKVDAQTLFANASTTKAMTAFALALLVDEGKLKWSDKVIKHLPEFKVADPYLTNELTIRDLLTHTGGMGNADFLWAWNTTDPQAIMRQFALAKPAYSLRSGFIYQNVMYMIAGEVVAKLSGLTWAEFMRQRVFTPLSMQRSFPLLSIAKTQANRVTAHNYRAGTKDLIPVEDSNADGIHAAGSVWSCADDMAKWMLFLLDSTRIGGKRLLSETTFSELMKPQVILPRDFYPAFSLIKPRFTTYALGWFQHDYKGRQVSFHTGSLNGTIAICGLIPEEGIGIFVYGNRAGAELRHALMYRTFDVLLGETNGRDWNTDLKKIYDSRNARFDSFEVKQAEMRILGTSPSMALEKYAGTYTDSYYGDVIVRFENGQLKAQFTPRLTTTLEHWHFDTFKGSYDGQAWINPALHTFSLDQTGKVARLTVGGTTWIRK